MSCDLSPREALALVPGIDVKRLRISPLQGGLTNRNFLVTGGTASMVLRLDDDHTVGFDLDRETELTARRNAAAAGLASEILWADAARGILLSRYVDGRVWQAEDLDNDDRLRSLARLLANVHRLPRLGRAFDAGRVAKTYAAVASEREALMPFAASCERIVSSSGTAVERVCCHNDVVAGNVIEDDSLLLLDWEYAADNDPLFDIASLICYHDLDDRRAELLLFAYAGKTTAELRERLEIQRRLFDALQWLWFAARQARTPGAGGADRLQVLQARIK